MAANRRTASSQRPRPREAAWASLPTKALLKTPLRDLKLSIEGTWLEQATTSVRQELANKGFRFKPHFWLSEDWFVPHGVTGVAIPFFLAHPRLIQLERLQMLEVEGGTFRQCAKILRHEMGHVVQNAYRFQRRKRWRELFGSSTTTYPDYYRPNPASKRFVHHLGSWYAQSHPDEDFAETFAVWLTPKLNWRKDYEGWPALRKLEYVDSLMGELSAKSPTHVKRTRPYSLSRSNLTLEEYYFEKRAHYLPDASDAYDQELLRLFPPERKGREPAAAFLRRHRKEIRQMVTRWTGEYQFTAYHVLNEMSQRAKELELRVSGPTKELKIDFAIVLTIHTMNLHFRRREWHPL